MEKLESISNKRNIEARFETIDLEHLEFQMKNYILIVQDKFSKYTQAYPLHDKAPKTIVNNLLVNFMHLGVPKQIHCDLEKEFK